jgi:hypothetical protein
MKKKLTQKEIEQHYFEMFRKDYSLPYGTIIYDDKPDVILEGARKIGIEITNFYLEKGELLESEQRQRDLRASVISEAQRAYQASNKEKIELTIGFDKTNPIRDTKTVVQKLVGLAEQIKGNGTDSVDGHFFQNIPEISYVYLYTEKCAAPEWRGVQVYSGSLMSRDDLIRIVRDKEESSKQYKKCDSFWLLVVVDFMDRAQDQEIPIDDFGKIESNVFEKIIVYKTHFGHVLEAK